MQGDTDEDGAEDGTALDCNGTTIGMNDKLQWYCDGVRLGLLLGDTEGGAALDCNGTTVGTDIGLQCHWNEARPRLLLGNTVGRAAGGTALYRRQGCTGATLVTDDG